MFVPESKTHGVKEGRNVRMTVKKVTHSGMPPGTLGKERVPRHLSSTFSLLL